MRTLIAFLLLVAAAWAQHDMTDKTFPEFYEEVALRPIEGSRLLYFNWELAREMGLPGLPRDNRMTRELAERILREYGVHTAAPDDPRRSGRVGYATRYDDAFGGLGDGRSVWLTPHRHPTTGELFDITLKGSGPTPFADPTVPQVWNRDGKMLLKHAIWETVASRALIANGVRAHDVLAIIETPEGFQTFGKNAKPSPTSIMVRVGTLFRPGHFRAFDGQPDKMGKLVDYFSDRYGIKGPNKAEELLRFHARESGKRVAGWNDLWMVHGALSWGNITMDRTSIDLTSAGFLKNPKADTTTRAETFGEQRWEMRRMALELEDMFRRNGLIDKRVGVGQEFDRAYRDEYAFRKLQRAGLQPETARRIMHEAPRDAHRLADVLARMDQLEGAPNRVHNSRRLLGEFAKIYFDPNADHLERARELMRGPRGSPEPSTSLAREFVEAYDGVMKRAAAYGEKPKGIQYRAERLNISLDGLSAFRNSASKRYADQIRDGRARSLQSAIHDAVRRYSPVRPLQPFAREAGVSTAAFAAAYLLKETFKGNPRGALYEMKEPMFWGSLAAFTGAAKATDWAVKGAPRLARAALPLTAGMAAVQLLTGQASLKNVLIGTASYLVAGAAVNLLADSLIYPLLFAAGPPGWIAAGAYTIGKLAVTLYVGEKIEEWLRRRTRSREGFARTIERLGEK